MIGLIVPYGNNNVCLFCKRHWLFCCNTHIGLKLFKCLRHGFICVFKLLSIFDTMYHWLIHFISFVMMNQQHPINRSHGSTFTVNLVMIILNFGLYVTIIWPMCDECYCWACVCELFSCNVHNRCFFIFKWIPFIKACYIFTERICWIASLRSLPLNLKNKWKTSHEVLQT